MTSNKKRDEEVKIDNTTWLEELYKNDLFTTEELLKWYNEIEYQGFNKEEVLRQLKQKIPNNLMMAKAIILIAVRGPQKALNIPLSSNTTLKSLGIPAGGGKGSKGLTCNRILASTSDLAAFYLKRINFPKRVDSELPGWLQFPSAGSIKMPQRYRDLHKEFSKLFSPQIGGVFNEQIYASMERNAYLNESLRLF